MFFNVKFCFTKYESIISRVEKSCIGETQLFAGRGTRTKRGARKLSNRNRKFNATESRYPWQIMPRDTYIPLH